MSSIKIRTRRSEQNTLVRVLIQHPMETGRRRDEATGQLIPAHFITELTLMHNGTQVVKGNLSTAVSRNPYFTFELANAKLGDVIGVSWTDNLGLHDEDEIRIQKDDS